MPVVLNGLAPGVADVSFIAASVAVVVDQIALFRGGRVYVFVFVVAVTTQGDEPLGWRTCELGIGAADVVPITITEERAEHAVVDGAVAVVVQPVAHLIRGYDAALASRPGASFTGFSAQHAGADFLATIPHGPNDARSAIDWPGIKRPGIEFSAIEFSGIPCGIKISGIEFSAIECSGIPCGIEWRGIQRGAIERGAVERGAVERGGIRCRVVGC